MSKYTAGPWKVAAGCQIRSAKDQIAKAWMMRGDEGKANARLIAAAPDLLEALMMARDALATALRTAAPDWFETKEDIDAHVGINQIDTAIAKATGEAQ